MGGVKRACWRVLAGWLGWAAGLIRRRPSGGGPEAWRAVHFSFSHFGEDLVVFHLLADRTPENRGCYVDIGAFDPVRHSNTYLLHQHGWRGMNVDASAERIGRFASARPRDVNVVAAVSDEVRDLVFLEYPTSGTSRLAAADDAVRVNDLGQQPTAVTPCRTRTLTDLLTAHQLPAIDFLNVDCEGHDLAVLRGLDWARWTPRVIAAEANTPSDRDELVAYLTPLGYQLAAVLVVTLVFAHRSVADRLPPGLRTIA